MYCTGAPKMGIYYPYNGSVIPVSFATCSLRSNFGITLPEKLKAIGNAGFDAVELDMSDILAYGEFLEGKKLNNVDYDAIVEVAKAVKSIAREIGIQILMLKSLANFEGWQMSSQAEERADAFARARGWLRVMGALETDMLQVRSSDAASISQSNDDLATDLAKLADMCAERGFRVAYENSCGTMRTQTWNTAWKIVERADRPNLGLCLDTFQIAGGEFGDPTTETGLMEDISRAELESRWRASLRKLTTTIPPEKIFLLQISDACKMEPPIDKSEYSQAQLPRLEWSHGSRVLPFDGGYLPVHDVVRAVLNTSFRGWFSIVVPDSSESSDTDVEAFTQTAMQPLHKIFLFS